MTNPTPAEQFAALIEEQLGNSFTPEITEGAPRSTREQARQDFSDFLTEQTNNL